MNQSYDVHVRCEFTSLWFIVAAGLRYLVVFASVLRQGDACLDVGRFATNPGTFRVHNLVHVSPLDVLV